MLYIVKPGEIPRSRTGKHLRNRFLILFRDGVVIVEEIPAHVLSIPSISFCLYQPGFSSRTISWFFSA